MITMPTPAQAAPVPVKSTGTSWAIQGNRAVIAALKLQDLIVDCTVEGLIHAPEWPEIEDAGRARLLVITNEHPEIPERTEPKAEHAARVTSAAGTDLTINLRDAPCGGTRGFATNPGGVAHWPGGLCLAFPGKDAVNGRVVMDVGDMNLTFKTGLTSRIDFTVAGHFVTAIKGDGIDALHLRRCMEAWGDRNAHGISHVSWGVSPGAKWVSAAMYDKRDMQAMEFRALPGSFLWSTGANQDAGRPTLGQFDLPMRNCSIALDGKIVVQAGVLQGKLAL